jgi:hypothetical protein
MHDPESHPTLTKATRELSEQVTALKEKLDLSESKCAKSRDSDEVNRRLEEDPDPDHNWMKAIVITIANSQ